MLRVVWRHLPPLSWNSPHTWKAVRLDGGAFFVDTEAHLQEQASRMADLRSISRPDVAKAVNWELLLPPGGRYRLDEARAEKMRRNPAATTWIVDLEQNQGMSSAPGELFPCLLSHGLHWNLMDGSLGRGRPATPREELLVQGMPAVRLKGNRFKCPFVDTLRDLEPWAIQKMAGNSMHAACVGELLGYILSRLDVKPLMQMPPSISNMGGVGSHVEDGEAAISDEEDEFQRALDLVWGEEGDTGPFGLAATAVLGSAKSKRRLASAVSSPRVSRKPSRAKHSSHVDSSMCCDDDI